jgi:hypothetical protein
VEECRNKSFQSSRSFALLFPGEDAFDFHFIVDDGRKIESSEESVLYVREFCEELFFRMASLEFSDDVDGSLLFF